jgi:N-acylneuraminate cytidylyltransferase
MAMQVDDLVIYLRPTTPFRSVFHLENAIKTLEQTDEATGLRSVEEMPESAFKCFRMTGPQLEPIYWWDGKNTIDVTDWPNQEVEKTYHPNGYIDIARVTVILGGELWGNDVIGYVTPRTIELDTPADWDYAEWYANRQVEQHIKFGRKDIT